MNLLDPPESLPPAARRRLRDLDTDHGTSLLWIAIMVLAGVGFVAFLATGANGPDDPTLTTSARQAPPGFGEAAFTLGPAEGLPAVDRRCGLTADTPSAQQEGMMGKRSLGGYDAMLFRFESDQTGQFWNRRVPIALSLAWFDANGAFIGSTDMPPCGDRDDCPLYSAPAPFRTVLEVPAGGLSRLGVGPGTVLLIDGPCDAP